ncbi:MAG: sodium:calcium antiporter [Gaiellaceae bacterium]
MDVVVQIALLAVGLALALVASDIAVSYTRALAHALGAPSFVVGVVLVALGTDLPEIANSIAAHLQNEGDVNVGDSVGSTLTQDTFVLGLFPLIVAVIAISRRQVGLVTGLTLTGLLLTAWFVSDGRLGRADGVVLVVAWMISIALVARFGGVGHVLDEPPEVRVDGHLARASVVLAMLLVVGVGATVAVRALVDLAESLGVPAFALAFFGASLGTSAPEIVVDLTALARGAPGIALGDALGSSLVDSTLSIGIGPIVQPAPVSARLAVVATLYTALAIAAVATLLLIRKRHDRVSAPVLIGLYALSYVVLISAD